MSAKTATANQNVFTLLFAQIKDFGANLEKKSSEGAAKQKVKFNLPIEKYSQKIKSAITFLRGRPKMSIGVGLGLIIIISVLVLFPGVNPNSAVKKVAGSQTDFTPQNQVTLNRKFEIPIRDAKGEETGSALPIILTTVDSSKRILIQGKPATSRDGKVFLILNLEIDNNSSNQLTIKPVDFIRLLDSEGKSFAPDVHNNEVKAEPISIKKTRVGFVVDENQKEFKFLVGEINGEKKEVLVKFN